jgi:hypothetical protein
MGPPFCAKEAFHVDRLYSDSPKSNFSGNDQLDRTNVAWRVAQASIASSMLLVVLVNDMSWLPILLIMGLLD